MSDITFIDWRGYPINVGDTVLYPSLIGRTARMTEGRVVDIYRVERHGLTGKWSRTDRPPSADEDIRWRISIQPTADSMQSSRGTPFTYDGNTYETAKTVTILNVQNVTQITASLLQG